ncbi:hypothetical protein Tco_0743699 [Tanacetum coccineum]
MSSFPLFFSSSSSSNLSSMDSTQASSSHGFKKIKLTIIPLKQLFVALTNDDNLTTPSHTTTSSSPTPPNAPSKTPSTNQTSSSQENTSSSFQSKLQISPPSSNEPTSPQPLNPLLDNISDVPPTPLNPQPLQNNPKPPFFQWWLHIVAGGCSFGVYEVSGYHRRHVRNEDLHTELDYYSKEYDEEREMEPKLVRVREATHVLRTRSPYVRRHKGRVVEFEEALNKDGSKAEREFDGRRTSE